MPFRQLHSDFFVEFSDGVTKITVAESNYDIGMLTPKVFDFSSKVTVQVIRCQQGQCHHPLTEARKNKSETEAVFVPV